MSLTYNGSTHYYIANLQGDVMSIVDGTGAVVVSYKYDHYGNILSTTGTLADTLGVINPLRYRGYVYDQECNLYYLQSRYYDSSIARFLNADSYASTGQGILGYNMFVYCGNNPVNRADPSGGAWENLSDFVTKVITEIVRTMSGASVVVLSNCEENWMTASQTMGKNMARAAGVRNSKVIGVTTQNFFETWNNITASYVIIHTHGSPGDLQGEDFQFFVQWSDMLETNTNIRYVLITACQVGGDNGDMGNIGQAFSQKIASNGLVICCTDYVVGGDTKFMPATDAGKWVVYQNGQLLPVKIGSLMTMTYAAFIFRNNT